MAGGVRHDEIFTLMHVLEEFRKLDPDLPIQYALSFLTLAQNEGMSMRELAERLGIAQSSASRNVAALEQMAQLRQAGPGPCTGGGRPPRAPAQDHLPDTKGP